MASAVVATARRRESTVRPASRMNGRVPVGRRVKRRSTRQRSRIRVPDSRSPVHLAWYVGVAVMALFEVIEWPLAIVVAVGHEIGHRSRNKALRELAEGIEAGG